MPPELDGAPRPPAGGWMDTYLETVSAPATPDGPTLPGLVGPVTSTGIPPMTSGDGFLVDPEKARAAIGRLEQMAADISRRLSSFRSGSTFDPPTSDGVGLQGAQNAQAMSGNAVAFVLALHDQIVATKGALQAQVDAYERVDRTNASRV